jgi:hypothetical protein
VALVEWAERVAQWLPVPHLHVLLEHPPGTGPHGDPGWRRIRLAVVRSPGAPEAPGAPGEHGLAELVRHLPLPAGVDQEP